MPVKKMKLECRKSHFPGPEGWTFSLFVVNFAPFRVGATKLMASIGIVAFTGKVPDMHYKYKT